MVDQIQSRTYYEYQTFSDEVYRVKGVPSYWRSRNIKRGISLPVDTIIECINAVSLNYLSRIRLITDHRTWYVFLEEKYGRWTSLFHHVLSNEQSPTEGIFVIEHYGAKATEYPSDATAYPHRDIDRVVTFNGFGFQDEAARIRVMVSIEHPHVRLRVVTSLIPITHSFFSLQRSRPLKSLTTAADQFNLLSSTFHHQEWIAFCTERLSILFTGGSYINYDGGTALDSFGSNLPRLRKVKRMYDPDNIFHCNTNIKPEGADWTR